jgi:hypothetical protein
LIWSARAASKAASDSISSKVNESLSSLTSMDEDEYYMNPNDPTRVSLCHNMSWVLLKRVVGMLLDLQSWMR